MERIEPKLAAAMLIDWRIIDGASAALQKRFTFNSFDEAWGWMSKIAAEATRLNHHPEWSNVYNVVDVSLTTHDAGGVTMLDVELGSVMDSAAMR